MITSNSAKSLAYPLCIFHTRRGTLFHLTNENQKLLDIRAVQINLPEFFDKKGLLSNLKDGHITFKKYLGIENYLTYVTVSDAVAAKKNLGTSKDNEIKIFCNGYKELTIERFNSIVETLNPDIIVSMTENPEVEASGQKGNKRAIQKNLNFLDATIKHFNEKFNLSKIYGAIQVTKYDELFDRACKETTSRAICGLVIHGLCQNETLATRETLYNRLKNNLDPAFTDDKQLVLSSMGEPCDVLHAVQFGISVFETEYPFAQAEKGIASTYHSQMPEEEEKRETVVVNDKTNKIEHREHIETSLFVDKKAAYVDLFDEKYKGIAGPIQEKCDCYTCKYHTMAYIHHMLKCDEMTAFVLIVIHNVHVYTKLFEKIHKILHDKSRLKSFITWFLKYQVN